MTSPTDTLAQYAILRQLLLERVSAGLVSEVERTLRELADELTDTLLSGKPLTDYKARRLEGRIRELVDTLTIPAPYLAELPLIEAQSAVSGLALISVEATLPTTAALSAIASSTLVQGATIGDWFAKLSTELRFDVERVARQGVASGLTNQQIAKSITGLLTDGPRGSEPFKRAQRDAEAITRTAVQTISQQAHMATYLANPEIIKAVQWLSTLDSRTTDICMARSGKTWSLPDMTPQRHTIPWNGGPPAHWRCRSRIIPVTRTFRELGIDLDELPEGTRSSQYGQVSAMLTFDKWLDTQPREVADSMLGKGRAQMWRNGDISLSQLLDQRGNPLTIKELRDRYGG